MWEWIPGLHETASSQCFACQTPLTAEEQADPRYVEHVSCPYCFKTTEEQQREQIEQRHAAIRAATTPLPGSVHTIINARCTFPLRAITKRSSTPSTTSCRTSAAKCGCKTAQNGRITDKDGHPVSADHVVRAGGHYLHLTPALREPDVNPDIRVCCLKTRPSSW